jgi:hypothetical protein
MNNNVKNFIELYIDLLDNNPKEFFEKAVVKLSHPCCEDLIHYFYEADIDMPDTNNLLMRSVIHDEINWRSTNTAPYNDCARWAKWMISGYGDGTAEEWAKAALEDYLLRVYETPYGWEGDHDYLIIRADIPLIKFINSENMEIYEQTGERNALDIRDFKLVTSLG